MQLPAPPTVDLKSLILNALTSYRGDAVTRARSAFSRCTPAQMQEPYASGLTRAQILAEYEQHAADVDAAIQLVREKL